MSAIFRATPQEPSKQCLGHCCKALSQIRCRVVSYAAVSGPRKGRMEAWSAWRRDGNAPQQPSPPRYQRTHPTWHPQGDPTHPPRVQPGPWQQQHPCIPAGAHPPQRHRRHPGRTTPQHAGASGPSQLTVGPSQLSGENRPGRRIFSFPNSCTAVC